MSEEMKNITPEANDTEENEGLLELLRHLAEASAEGEDSPSFMLGDSDDDTEGMTASDYHNKAVDYARRKNLSKAVDICIDGLAIYADNVDLLADVIKYSSEHGDFSTAQEYYEILSNRIPRANFNWRAYTFSFDYLMLNSAVNENACRELVADYIKYLPFEEKARMAKSELEEALGNHQASMDVLVEAIDQLPNAPQCALRLADMQLNRGLYGDVVNTVNYGLMASAEPQPSINIPYLYYIRNLAEDALLHAKSQKGAVERVERDRIVDTYECMLKEFPELMHHKRNITMRMKMLGFLNVEN